MSITLMKSGMTMRVMASQIMLRWWGTPGKINRMIASIESMHLWLGDERRDCRSSVPEPA